MKLWIVHGTTGEYSDRGEWTVEAHTTQEAAEARVEALTAKLQQSGIGLMTRWEGPWERAREAFRADPDGDPHFDIDYTGTSWFVSECELKQPLEIGGSSLDELIETLQSNARIALCANTSTGDAMAEAFEIAVKQVRRIAAAQQSRQDSPPLCPFCKKPGCPPDCMGHYP